MFLVIRICCLTIAWSLMHAAVAEEDVRVPLVIHMDDAMLRCGFAGEDGPRYRQPLLLGRPAHRGTMIGANQKQLFAGDEAQSKRRILNLSYPIQKNRVQNWDDLQAFLREILCVRYKIDLHAHPILLVLPVDGPFENIQRYKEMIAGIRQQQPRKKGQALAQGTEGIACVTDALMALYETGRVTGVSVLMNAGVITVVSVYESQPMPHTMFWKNISIADVNTYLAKQLLENRQYTFKSVAEMEMVEDIRSKLCFVADHYKETLRSAEGSSELDQSYELPDGQVLTIGKERFIAPECLFQPEMIGKDETSLPKILLQSIMHADVDIRRELFRNVVIVGDHSMYDGLSERLGRELTALAPPAAKARVIAVPERKYAAWIGASMYALMKAGPLRKQLYPQEK